MPRYEITGPDGHKYAVTAPEGASEADVLEYVKAEASKAVPAAVKAAPSPLTTQERRTYAEALPGTPEGAAARKTIEDAHGGREATSKEIDPAADFMGRHVVPPLVVGGLAAGVPGLAASAGPMRYAMVGGVPTLVEPGLAEIAATAMGGARAAGSGAKAVATSPAVREALKWLARGALGAEGFDLARRLMK